MMARCRVIFYIRKLDPPTEESSMFPIHFSVATSFDLTTYHITLPMIMVVHGIEDQFWRIMIERFQIL